MFTFRTDRHVLCWILNLADASGKIARGRLQSLEFYFEAVHRSGVKHQAADGFSRLSTNGSDYNMLEDDIRIIDLTQSNEQASKSARGDTANSSHDKIN